MSHRGHHPPRVFDSILLQTLAHLLHAFAAEEGGAGTGATNANASPAPTRQEATAANKTTIATPLNVDNGGSGGVGGRDLTEPPSLLRELVVLLVPRPTACTSAPARRAAGVTNPAGFPCRCPSLVALRATREVMTGVSRFDWSIVLVFPMISARGEQRKRPSKRCRGRRGKGMVCRSSSACQVSLLFFRQQLLYIMRHVSRTEPLTFARRGDGKREKQKRGLPCLNFSLPIYDISRCTPTLRCPCQSCRLERQKAKSTCSISSEV